MDFKESLQRLTVWAKQHPYIAGLLVIGTVFLAYLAYKRGGTGSFSASSPGALGDKSVDPLGDFSSIGSAGMGGSVNDTITPTPDPAPKPVIIANSSGGGGGYDSLGSFNNLGDYGFDGGGFDYSSLDMGGGFSSGAAMDTPQSNLFLKASSVDISGRSKGPVITKGEKGSKTQPNKIRSKPRSRPDASPAYLAGKGQHFTGIHEGVVYVDGYPSYSMQLNAPPSVWDDRDPTKGVNAGKPVININRGSVGH